MSDHDLAAARLYADGLSTFLVRHLDGDDEWVVFDRSAGSERDLVVVAEAFGAIVVQRSPTGIVRIVGPFGVYRWAAGLYWQHQPSVGAWIDTVGACATGGDAAVVDVVETLLEFAVHDLGARNIGATLVYRPDPSSEALLEKRLGRPPALQITRPADLGPLRHALAQIDGATLFDATGTLIALGVRLVPSRRAEDQVDGLGGMRHTSGRRYSFDDPHALVVVVSEDGPVTVMRNGAVLGASKLAHGPDADDGVVGAHDGEAETLTAALETT